MKLSESVVESFGNQEVDSSVDDLTNKLANKIKILKDLKNEAGNPEVDYTDETVDKVIEETFKDKSIAKSFGDDFPPKIVEQSLKINENMFFDFGPGGPWGMG